MCLSIIISSNNITNSMSSSTNSMSSSTNNNMSNSSWRCIGNFTISHSRGTSILNKGHRPVPHLQQNVWLRL
eukprot:m.172590 g.172590  ORF g.172590 m.172590 type:complete len:72 (+) comp17300_c3_seq2:2578-2793(+)